MELKRVVVTGLGALTPIGNNLQDYWNNLIMGVSGAAPITYFDTTEFKTKFACELKNFSIADHLDRKEIKTLRPFFSVCTNSCTRSYGRCRIGK